MPTEAFTNCFRGFLDWSLKRDWVGSDLLPHLAKTWKTWLGYDSEAGKTAKHFCQAAAREPATQSAFIHWLGTQPEFEGGKLIFALFQLAQCREFERWSELAPYRTLPEDFKQRGINGLFLREGRGGSADDVKKLVAVIAPRAQTDSQPTSPRLIRERVRPINFRAGDGTALAMEQAGEAALQFLRWRGLGVLLAYLLGGDLIFLTFPRVLRTLSLWRRWQQTVKHADFYVLIDHSTGSEVVGPSLGLATSLAIITAAVRQSAGDSPQPASPQILLPSRLSGCAFTGSIQNNGKIGHVDGIPKKVHAMEAHPGIELGVIPKDNLADCPEQRAVEILGAKSLSQVLRRLIPIRKTWGAVNIFLMLSLPLILISGWRLIDRSLLPPPAVRTIKTGLGAFAVSYAQAPGCEVRELDRITLVIEHARNDGLTRISVTAPGDARTGLRRQCLKSPEESDDWHPEVALPVQNGRVVFDYQSDPSLPGASETLKVVTWREGRAVEMFGLPLNIR